VIEIVRDLAATTRGFRWTLLSEAENCTRYLK